MTDMDVENLNAILERYVAEVGLDGGYWIMNQTERIQKALGIAYKSGNSDETHHLQWTVDQMVRALTDCPIIEMEAIGADGKTYTCEGYGESKMYQEWISKYNTDGFKWDIGIAP